MIPKQAEMDGIVEQIYRAIEIEKHLHSTLFVLCGDHGMNDAGNHGGSAEGETSPALVFMSPKLQTICKGSECPAALPESAFSYYTTVEQSDIAPTLAGLLGFPIPLNNLGVFIPDLLGFWDEGWWNRKNEVRKKTSTDESHRRKSRSSLAECSTDSRHRPGNFPRNIIHCSRTPGCLHCDTIRGRETEMSLVHRSKPSGCSWSDRHGCRAARVDTGK